MELQYPKPHKGRKDYSEFLCRFIKKRLNSGRVLDIGCNCGYFLKELEDKGFDAYGIDISEELIKKAKKITNAKLEVASAEENLPFRNNFFNVVTMFDVIEHIKNYKMCLKEVYRILKNRGLLLVITPNSNSILKFLFGRNWHWYKNPTHIHMFSENQLITDLQMTGFKNINSKTFFNFYIAGETTEILTMLRPVRRIVFFPIIGDAIFINAEKVHGML